MIKKIKKFLNSKGGIWAVLGTIAFILIAPAALFIQWGIESGWNWQQLADYLTNDIAMTVYIVCGLVIFGIVVFYANVKLRKEI